MSTVMIVDDSKTSRSMLRNILTEHGYEVVLKLKTARRGTKDIASLILIL